MAATSFRHFICFLLFLGTSGALHAQSDMAGRIELKLEPPRELLNCYLPHYRIQRPKVGLALSGGGARGLAHIGVLKALERAGIQVDMIAGTSMGSIVGGLYAAGYSADQLQHLAEEADWSDLFVDTPRRSDLFLGQKQEKAKHIFQVRFDGLKPYIPQAYTAGQKLSNFLTSLTLEADCQTAGDFDRLPIPFRTVTTDLVSGAKVVLASGNLGEALRASLTIPLLFTPVERDTQLLIDGGIVDYLPIDVVRDMGADVVIAVNILNSLHPKEGLQAPWQIADQVISIIMMISNERQIPEADVLIDPDLRGHSSLDFSNIPRLIQWGEEATEARMEQIRRVIEERSAPGDDHRFVVSSLDVEGLRSVDRSTLIEAISTQEGDTCGLLGLRRDLERIYNLGHFRMVSADLEADTTHTESAAVSVRLHVEENPLLRKIILKGISAFPSDTILSRLHSVPGLPINFRTSEEDIRAILNLYHLSGYVLARVEDIQFDEQTGDVTIIIDEGLVADIHILGNHRTREHVIQREFPLRRGRIFNLEQANRGVKNIYSTGLFDRVDLKIQRSGNATVVGLDVEEKKHNIIRVGARYDREYTTEEFIELLDDNLFGHGAKLNMHLQYGERRQQYELRYRADRFLKTYLTYGGRAYYQKRNQNLYGRGQSQPLAYQERRWGGRLAIGQQMYRLGTVSVEGRAEEVKLEADEQDLGTLGHDQIRSITVRSVVDNLDRYPFPSSGNYSHLFLEAATNVLGGTATYLKFFGTLESYVTILKRHTLHPQVSFGSMDQITPFSERFKVGGNRTFCDYPGEEYAIRLYGYHDEELVGRQLLWANLEYRYKTPWIPRLDLYLSGRYDIGYLWQEAEAFRSDQIRQAWGAGIAVDTPVGPAELSYGRFKEGDDRFYVSLGYWF